MSRYVDLDGLTWDGKFITSKIQEVKTKHGYMQAITIGWLWGDNVPHIDLAEHDKQIRDEVIEECIRAIEEDKSLFDNHKTDCIMAIKTRCQNVLKKLKGEQNE